MFATTNTVSLNQRVHVNPQAQNTGRSYMSAMSARGVAPPMPQRTYMGLKATGSTTIGMSASNFVIGSKPTITKKQSMGIRQHKSLISAQMNGRFTPAPSMIGQQASTNQFSNFKVSGLTSMIGKSFNRAGTALNSLPK